MNFFLLITKQLSLTNQQILNFSNYVLTKISRKNTEHGLWNVTKNMIKRYSQYFTKIQLEQNSFTDFIETKMVKEGNTETLRSFYRKLNLPSGTISAGDKVKITLHLKKKIPIYGTAKHFWHEGEINNQLLHSPAGMLYTPQTWRKGFYIFLRNF